MKNLVQAIEDGVFVLAPQVSDTLYLDAAYEALSSTPFALTKFVPETGYETLYIHANAVNNPSEKEDDSVPGLYAVSVSAALSPGWRCMAALDAFHNTIAIGNLEDFSIEVYDKDGVPQSDPLVSYPSIEMDALKALYKTEIDKTVFDGALSPEDMLNLGQELRDLRRAPHIPFPQKNHAAAVRRPESMAP